MSNTNVQKHLMAAAFFDQRAEYVDTVIGFDGFSLTGSLRNPLQTMRVLIMDNAEGVSIDERVLAEVTGLPEQCFLAENLRLPMSALLPALGQCALLMLASMRERILIEDHGMSLELMPPLASVVSTTSIVVGGEIVSEAEPDIPVKLAVAA